MKRIIPLFILFFINCSTADITLDRESLKTINTVAILPFTSAVPLKKEILAAAEDSFRSAMIKLNYRIIEIGNNSLQIEDKEFFKTGVDSKNIKRIESFPGADAILAGEITEDKEVQRKTSRHTFGGLFFNNDRDEMEVKTFFKFNIIVRLLKVSDGSVIMTVKNTYAESEKDEYLPGYVTMDAYRNLVLKKMSNEIVDVLKSSSK